MTPKTRVSDSGSHTLKGKYFKINFGDWLINDNLLRLQNIFYIVHRVCVLQAVELRNGNGTDDANAEQRKARKKVSAVLLSLWQNFSARRAHWQKGQTFLRKNVGVRPHFYRFLN